MNMLFRLALGGALIGLLYQWAPGEPSPWMMPNNNIAGNNNNTMMDRGDDRPPPLPSMKKPGQDGQHEDDNDTAATTTTTTAAVEYSIQRFVGGDGSTKLVGRLYLPIVKTPEQPLARHVQEEEEQQEEQETSESDSGAGGASSSPPPIVVMAHGLGLTQDCRLDPIFVQAFREAGLAVLTFDYATFGESEGWPRHQVIPQRHVADLKAALAHVRGQNLSTTATAVDTTRIALWGTSLGGGHVLSVAAVDPDLRAVVATVPHVKSALESILRTLQRDPYQASLGLLKVSAALLKWIITKVTSTTSTATTYIPLHGPPGSSAMMQNPGDDEGYGRLVDHLVVPPTSSSSSSSSSSWKNLATVSSVLPVLFYRPFNTLHQISCPTLLLAAENDTLCPAADSVAAVRLLQEKQQQQQQQQQQLDQDHDADNHHQDAAAAAAAKTNNNNNNTTHRLRMISGGSHFDVYQGEALQILLNETVSFFKEHLLYN